MEKKLYRDELNKKVGGVCAGLADYFGVDVSIVRVIFLITAILHGTGAVIYVILWAVLPTRYKTFNNPYTDYRVPPQEPYGQPEKPNFTMPDFEAADKPFATQQQPCKTSKAGVGAGAILIVLGVVFLLNNFNLLPPFSFNLVWPVILVGIGLAFIFSDARKRPWEDKDWSKTNEAPAAPEEKKEETNNDNTPTA